MSRDNKYCVSDTSFNVWRDSEQNALQTYKLLAWFLKRNGFSVTPDPRIKKNYPMLSKSHRIGRYRNEDLQFSLEHTGFHVELTFFQDAVFENPNGGRYDFNKLSKMPYLVRLRWLWTKRLVHQHLLSLGLTFRQRISSPIPDPLAYFNDRWDSDYEISRDIHRFPRRADGWPDESALKSWRRHGVDGEVINHGDVVYFRECGHPMRGRAYGGINGMWLVVYGPNQRDFSQVHVSRLSHTPIAKGRWFDEYTIKQRLKAKLEKAVQTMDFERAIGLRDALARYEMEEVRQ